MAEALVNEYVTTLAESIDDDDTEFDLTDAPPAGLAGGNFRLRIGAADEADPEYILVGSVSGATLSSVTRGEEGSSAASWASGTVVAAVLTVAGLADAVAAVATDAEDVDYTDTENIGETDVQAAIDLIIQTLVANDLLIPLGEIDRWVDRDDLNTAQGRTMTNVTRATANGPDGRAYLSDPSNDHRTYLTITGLTSGHQVKVDCLTNGAANVGGSGGGTFLRITVSGGNTDLDAQGSSWIARTGTVTIGGDGQLVLKGVFHPAFADLIITDLG